jgi:hypothetical protein
VSASHAFKYCRAAYKHAREQGSPPVLATELGKDFIVLETKDGKTRMEGLRRHYDGCCLWAMKFNCAEKWLDKNKKGSKSES